MESRGEREQEEGEQTAAGAAGGPPAPSNSTAAMMDADNTGPTSSFLPAGGFPLSWPRLRGS